MLTELNIQKIKNILIVAEQGTPTIQYGKVYVMNDGPQGIKQLTLSIGFTQFGGNLEKVIEEYVKRDGKYSKALAPMLPVMKRMDTVSNQGYIAALKEAGVDPIMRAVQDEMFSRLYIGRGLAWGEAERFILSLSYLVICDSFLHSGSMLPFLRQRFPERTPANGGLEKTWTRDYTRVRHNWLASHEKQLLRKTIYRTTYYTQLIIGEDWGLEGYYNVAMNGVRPLNVA